MTSRGLIVLGFVISHIRTIKLASKGLVVILFVTGDLVLLSVLGSKMAHYQITPAEPSTGFGINISSIRHNFGEAIVSIGEDISSFTGTLGKTASTMMASTKNLAITSAEITFGYSASASPAPALVVASQTLNTASASSVSLASFIKPTDDTPVPIIKEESSLAALAKFNEQQRRHIERLIEQQAAANQKLDGQITASSSYHGGYPAKWDNLPQDYMLDNWGMYNRECVSYTAFKVYQTYGHMPYWGGIGNANEWLVDAENANIAVGSKPRIHSVAVSTAGYFGHTAWVEKISGNKIYVSQYNYNLDGRYSEMWVNANYFSYIYFR